MNIGNREFRVDQTYLILTHPNPVQGNATLYRWFEFAAVDIEAHVAWCVSSLCTR